MFCKYCGAKLEEDAMYCGNCGARTDAGGAVSYALYVTVALFGIGSVLLYVSFKP